MQTCCAAPLWHPWLAAWEHALLQDLSGCPTLQQHRRSLHPAPQLLLLLAHGHAEVARWRPTLAQILPQNRARAAPGLQSVCTGCQSYPQLMTRPPAGQCTIVGTWSVGKARRLLPMHPECIMA